MGISTVRTVASGINTEGDDRQYYVDDPDVEEFSAMPRNSKAKVWVSPVAAGDSSRLRWSRGVGISFDDAHKVLAPIRLAGLLSVRSRLLFGLRYSASYPLGSDLVN